jgi:hypothetical protein
MLEVAAAPLWTEVPRQRAGLRFVRLVVRARSLGQHDGLLCSALCRGDSLLINLFVLLLLLQAARTQRRCLLN